MSKKNVKKKLGLPLSAKINHTTPVMGDHGGTVESVFDIDGFLRELFGFQAAGRQFVSVQDVELKGSILLTSLS